MPSVTIDPGVFAAPPMSVTHEEIIQYVITLLDWKMLLREPWVAIYLSEHVSQALFEDAVYPLRDNLKALFKAKGVTVYDTNTVAQVIDQLLSITPSFETYFKIRDIRVEDVTTTPDIFSIHTSKGLSSELARIVVMIAILRSCCHQPILDHSLIVKPPWSGGKIEVSAQILDIESSRDDLQELPEPPKYFHGEILTCQNFREFVQNLDETAIWQAADCESGLEIATRIAIYKSRIQRGSDPDWDKIQGFHFGSEFFGLTRGCERSGIPGLVERTIRAIVETIDHLNLQDVHGFRAGRGGNSPTRMRGQDKAWRRNIDYSYRLHYWECVSGEIEFAAVGPHNYFEIP